MSVPRVRTHMYTLNQYNRLASVAFHLKPIHVNKTAEQKRLPEKQTKPFLSQPNLTVDTPEKLSEESFFVDRAGKAIFPLKLIIHFSSLFLFTLIFKIYQNLTSRKVNLNFSVSLGVRTTQ